MKHLDLFSGIGGFSLAADRVWPGMEHEFCEIDPFCQEVLKKHWPNAKINEDIRQLTKSNSSSHSRGQESHGVHKQPRKEGVEAGQPYLLTGGFPCQPFSQAGRRKGKEDDRHLWPEMLRVIKEFKPTWIVGENVAGIVSMVLDEVCTQLEAEGYEVRTFIIPAVALNAPHRRDRIWIVAHSQHESARHSECLGNDQGTPAGATGSDQVSANSTSDGLEGRRQAPGQRLQLSREGRNEGSDWNKNWVEVATRLCRVDDGLPRRLDRSSRLKALGNAIVPQVAEEIFKAIKEIENRI